MKATLMRYILLGFLKNAALLVAGLTALLLSFDMMANAGEVLAHQNNGLRAALAYAFLRLPAITTLVIPFAAMLAAITTLTRMAQSGEIIALTAAGMTIYRIVLIFTAGAALLGAFHFWLADRAVPGATTRLNAWEDVRYKGLPPDRGANVLPAWFASGQYRIHVQQASPDGATLYNLTIVRVEEGALITRVLRAGLAVFDRGAWSLNGVEVAVGDRVREQVPDQKADTAPVPGRLELAITPEDVANLRDDPVAMDISALIRLMENRDIATTGRLQPGLWLQYKFASPLASLILVLIAMPIALHVERRGSLMTKIALIIAAGFAYMVVTRIVFSLGQTGTLHPGLAVWTPPVIFGVMAVWVLLLMQERR